MLLNTHAIFFSYQDARIEEATKNITCAVPQMIPSTMINIKESGKETHITPETTLTNQGRKIIKTYKRIENVITRYSLPR